MGFPTVVISVLLKQLVASTYDFQRLLACYWWMASMLYFASSSLWIICSKSQLIIWYQCIILVACIYLSYCEFYDLLSFSLSWIRLGGFSNLKKDGTSHAGKIVQPVLKLLNDESSEAIWVRSINFREHLDIIILGLWVFLGWLGCECCCFLGFGLVGARVYVLCTWATLRFFNKVFH